MSIGSKLKEEGVTVPLKLQKASIMRQLHRVECLKNHEAQFE